MSQVNYTDNFLNYSYIGQLVRCTDNGFGFIRNQKKEEFFVHINSLVMGKSKNLRDLQGKFAIFTLGGDPFRYKKGKVDWENSIVQWKLFECNSDDPVAAFLVQRDEAFSSQTLGQWESLLQAEWYINRWKKVARTSPQTRMNPSIKLGEVLLLKLRDSKNLGEYLRLLQAIITSPFYSSNSAEYPLLCERFFKPEDLLLKVFCLRKPLDEYRCAPDVLPLIKDQLQEYIAKAEVVSIDLESDRASIYQYGWKNAEGSDSVIGLQGNPVSQDQLRNGVSKSVGKLFSPCLVGHNFYRWDLPILKNHRIDFPENYRIWDTLMVSWLLEPWKVSHALIVNSNAHQADADAVATYALFEEQYSKLRPYLDGKVPGIQELVDLLYNNQDLLGSIPNRSYPNSIKQNDSRYHLFTGNQRSIPEWQQGCQIQFFSPELRSSDPVLVPKICCEIASVDGCLYSKLVALIVSDAMRSNVQVRLSMIPLWLIDKSDELRNRLRSVHNAREAQELEEDGYICYLSEDLFRLEEPRIKEILSNRVFIHSPFVVLIKWNQLYCENLTDLEVSERFPEVLGPSNSGYFLTTVNDKLSHSRWLLREPSGLGEENSEWTIYPQRPDWLSIPDDLNSKPFLFKKTAKWAALPRWTDGDSEKLNLERIFVSPDTENRRLYLADMLHCVLNILRKSNSFLIVTMRRKGEAEIFEKYLAKLSLTANKSHSPLRQIEYVYDHNFNVVVCSHDKLSQYMQAAKKKNIAVRVVVDSLPIHEWYCAFYPAEKLQKQVTISGKSAEDQWEDDVETEKEMDSSKFDIKRDFPVIRFAEKDIWSSIDSFLVPWIQELISSDEEPKYPILILDARIYDRPLGKRRDLPWESCPFFNLEELLNEDKRNIYDFICFPRKDILDVPNSYESYRSFLNKHWGYSDFREGPQQEAIHALVENKDDLLLRLPTGGGKSIVFHLPALLRSSYTGRLTVVITPLRALMADQVEGLWKKQFTESVDYLSGGRDAWLNHDAYQGILDGRVKLIFVAPERFRVSRFTDVLERRRRLDGGLEFIVFDETHCVSEWGFEFRPDYLYAAQFVAKWFKEKKLPGNPQRLLLTSATVTERNKRDLEKELGLGVAGSYTDLPKDLPHPIQSFINLSSYDVPENESNPDADPKLEKMIDIIATMNLSISAVIIFVRRRKDCHLISEFLNKISRKPRSPISATYALPFHAGLPEEVKAEACELLKKREANVLVCTKAFGMGMDIPHMHVCIHHRPPTYIEDYLQEVGRIGRDKSLRLQAGKEQVEATLLYNLNDIERNVGILQENAIRPPDLQLFMEYCAEKAVHFRGIGKKVCLIPSSFPINGGRALNENRVATSLFWLERAGVLRVEGKHPPFIDLSTQKDALYGVAGTETLPARIAKALLQIISDSKSVLQGQSNGESGTEATVESSFDRFIRGLTLGFHALIADEQPASSVLAGSMVASSIQDTSPINISVSMNEIIGAVGGIDMDDLYKGLFELDRRKFITIRKSFAISRFHAKNSLIYWDLLNKALDKLLRVDSRNLQELSRVLFEIELDEWYQNKQPMISKEHRLREIRRVINTSLRLCRYSGVEIKESIADNGSAVYKWVIGGQQVPGIRKCEGFIKKLQALVTFVNNQDHELTETFNIEMSEIIHHFGSDLRISELKKLMKLMETSGFYGLVSTDNTWVSIVTLNRMPPLPDPSGDESKNQILQLEDKKIQETYEEMNKKHRLQELRAQCMVLLAVLPQENRRNFIDKYFEALSGDDIEALLEDTVGDVDDNFLQRNPILGDILAHVRQERFEEEITRLNNEQLRVCMAPYQQNLLVNAGPGSGKTHVLMMRCAHLIHRQGVNPKQILVLAFNRAVVFEIRKRIRDLFRNLGYGSYVNQLDVSTFHSFAMRHLTPEDYFDQDVVENTIHQFAKKISTEKDFAESIFSQYQAILVDEFQDMNQDFYAVVHSIVDHSSGGTMVIGDDDQDILTWNRYQWQENYGSCPLTANEYFMQFNRDHNPENHQLTVNYRSVSQVVERANGMIAKVAKEIGFLRMKDAINLSANRKEDGNQKDYKKWSEGLQFAIDAFNRGEEVAVLCRSNRECRKAYEDLVQQGMARDQLNIMGGEDFGLYQLRNYGCLMELMENKEPYIFVDEYLWKKIVADYVQLKHADFDQSIYLFNDLYELVKKEYGRPRISDFINFIREMNLSDIERLKSHHGMVGWQEDNDQNTLVRITVSTIHKVKGLEYETVIILPSAEQFPMRANGSGVNQVDSAEEARLYYVAMTRARDQLYVGWGPRESNWYKMKQKSAIGQDGVELLRGTPKEVFVTWAGQTDQVEGGLQLYIEKNICEGDLVNQTGKQIKDNNGRQVAMLSRAVFNSIGDNNQFRVSHVLRYTCGENMRQKNSKFYNQLHEDIKNQRWCYSLLLENF